MLKGISWLAGLLEGDGCFTTNGKGNQPRISIAMLDKDIVEEAAFLLKSNVTTYKTSKGKIMYRTSVAKKSVVEPLLNELYPYLGNRRKERVRELLALYNQE